MLLIFDFDNTLEEFAPFEETVETDIFKKLGAKHLVDPLKMKQVFDGIKLAYAHPRAEPRDHGRNVWFSETFHVFHIEEPVHEWVQYYWEQIFSLVRVWPGTYQILEELKNEHTLCILSDSDGDLQTKLSRIEQLGLTKYFDTIFTSDMAGHNKPHPRMFLQVLEHYKVAAEECVMIGDTPNIDLSTAKELGMHTIWQKQCFGKNQPHTHYEYVDYEIERITEVPYAIEQITSRILLKAKITQ
jgi:HAD superfamily hydrolase (TIGR01509 family)